MLTSSAIATRLRNWLLEAGMNIGTTATPKYQGLIVQSGFCQNQVRHFSLFGIGGLSTIDFIGKDCRRRIFRRN
ncbi:MAG: hypothetical protein IPM82_16555 [Saprospiraceae bacterium]|nr:hypothetical protein [Saprospiraceae bacterium]